MANNDNLDAIRRQHWPFEGITVDDGEALYDVLVAIATEYDRVDDQITTLNEQRRLQTASGEYLEKLGREVGITRESGEVDDTLRFRILIAKASQRADGTFDDVASVLAIIFGDNVSKLTLTPKTDAPTTLIEIPVPVFDDIPLTKTELATALDRLLPVSDPIEINTQDRLLLGESGSQGLGAELS